MRSTKDNSILDAYPDNKKKTPFRYPAERESFLNILQTAIKVRCFPVTCLYAVRQR